MPIHTSNSSFRKFLEPIAMAVISIFVFGGALVTVAPLAVFV